MLAYYYIIVMIA